MRRALIAAIALAVLVACGCGGGPKQLGREDAHTLNDAQSRLGDALELEETLRSDPAAAKRLRGRVRKVVSSGAFEGPRTDEFGIAMLGELRRSVPSLVLERPSGDVLALDKPATRAFLRYATNDPKRALALPVRRQVDRIDDAVDDSDAGADTLVPPPNGDTERAPTVSDFLGSAETDLAPRYPDQAGRLQALRKGL